MTPSLEADLALARELIAEAAELATTALSTDFAARLKADGTPVTELDRRIETALALRLSQARLADEIVGEEFGSRAPSAPADAAPAAAAANPPAPSRRWILDPIDGTANFIAGRSDWGTHIALEQNGEIVLGIISRPARSLCWLATKGSGAHRTSIQPGGPLTRLRVSNIEDLTQSRVVIWAEAPHPFAERLQSMRIVKGNLDAILELAEGSIEAVVDPTGKPWDHAPAVILVREAGGRATDSYGGCRVDRGEMHYSNGRIHDAFVRELAP